MKLRTQAQAPAYCEVSSDSEEEDDAIEEYSPEQDRRKVQGGSGAAGGAGPSTKLSSKPRNAKARSSKRSQAAQNKQPELVLFVIETCGRQDLFDTGSLRALRATSKTYQSLLDRLGLLSHVTCKGYELGEVLQCTNLVDRMQQLTVKNQLDATLCTQLVLRNPPQLKELSLLHTGNNTSILVAGNFSNLTSLTLKHTNTFNRGFGYLGTLPTWPLRRLCIEGYHTNATQTNLYRIIERFPELTELELDSMTVNRSVLNYEAPATALQKLVKLNVGRNVRSLKNLEIHRFFRSPEEGLPTVSNLTIDVTYTDVLKMLTVASAWVKNLESLCLHHHSYSYMNASADYGQLFASLKGGALKTLELGRGISHKECLLNIDLPHLTALVVVYGSGITSDVISDICRATLPALRSLRVQRSFTSTTISVDITHFDGLMSAFPRLSNLSLLDFPPLSQRTLESISIHVLPYVQKLTLNLNRLNASDFNALTSLLRSSADDSDVLCPSLRVLNLCGESKASTDAEQTPGTKALAILAPIASHMPNLRCLILSKHYERRDDEWSTAINKLKTDLVGAWPLLKQLHCGFRAAPAMKKLWPLARVVT